MKNRNHMAAVLLGAVLAFTGCAAADTVKEYHSVAPEDLVRMQELLGTEEEETEGTEETETPDTEEEPADVPVCPGEIAGYFPAGNGATDSYFTVASITDTDGRSDTVLTNADGQMLVLEMDTALAEALQACPVDIFLYPVMDSGDAEDGEIPEMSKEEQDDFLLFAIESWYDTKGKAKDFYSLLQDFEGSAGKTRKDFSAEETAGFVEELLEMLPEGTAAGIREQLEEKMEDYAGSAGRAVMASYLLFDAQGNALGELSAEGITSYGQEAVNAIAGTMDQCGILMSAAPVSTLAEGACFVSGGQTLWNNTGMRYTTTVTFKNEVCSGDLREGLFFLIICGFPHLNTHFSTRIF
jgi:hypothetical protein